MATDREEIVFAPLGGLGEIGMNAALYGFGPEKKRKWILVDCGVAFAGANMPGVDLILPDLSFIEKRRADLLGLIVTHAHEDHVGAIASLWPRLGCPVYATRFAAGLLATRRLAEPGAPDVPIHEVKQGGRLNLGPFDIEFVPMSHSIPESNLLAIRTSAGLVVHTGDWKLDPSPGLGKTTDIRRLKEIGDEGVRALICDSTNILREGESPSEAQVAEVLREKILAAPGRVLVTTFASNVARLRAVCLAAEAAGRRVVLAGRAMERSLEVARECGYLDGVPELLSLDSFSRIPAHKTLVLATGSQGEARAAMARIVRGEHPVKLSPNDLVIFSSRTIPGNEREVNAIVNGLILQGVDVLTDRDALIHCSGHPRRGEVAQLYQWLRPQTAVPAHGEALHLQVHAEFARKAGVENVLVAHNGDLIALGPDAPAHLDQIAHGRLYQDGDLILSEKEECFRERHRLAAAGIISIAFALTAKGDVAGVPDVTMFGLPRKTRDNRAMDEVVDRALFETLESLPRARKRDIDAACTAVERAVRAAVGAVWGKKPHVHVLAIEV
ncbi:ribonuclease J [Rhodoblastus acidophilus]|uniref:ribonuclease J n=1 Tax=Candidatus Rhodoblastus alkanivorans TaxID=2954117 RepID=UPI001FAA673B|nr:ribonuclease J [Candidatus Rhodoblastus alkanivorans]MCI4678440.1 ribonuclease J [Candidatus Rhodoblastus alkanivorans]MDI4640196.1 ribonuclease J [Rhodoblastus acidophilus]